MLHKHNVRTSTNAALEKTHFLTLALNLLCVRLNIVGPENIIMCPTEGIFPKTPTPQAPGNSNHASYIGLRDSTPRKFQSFLLGGGGGGSVSDIFWNCTFCKYALFHGKESDTQVICHILMGRKQT